MKAAESPEMPPPMIAMRIMYFSWSNTSAAKADVETYNVIAAVNRCAAQNQLAQTLGYFTDAKLFQKC
jgi:hypothetical protein